MDAAALVKLTITAKKAGGTLNQVECMLPDSGFYDVFHPSSTFACDISSFADAQSPLVVETLAIRDFTGDTIEFNRNGGSVLGDSSLPAFFGL